MMTRTVKAIIFDMDGVVIDSNPYHRMAWEKLLNDNQIAYTEESFQKVIFGRPGKEALRILCNDRFSDEELTGLDEQVDAEYREIIRQTEINEVAGLSQFIESSRKSGIKIALATSAPTENVTLVLGRLGLQSAFDVITDYTDIVNGKPDPEIYLKTVAKLNIEKAACLVFEDSFSGIQSARSAGLDVVAVSTSHASDELLVAGAIDVVADFTRLAI